MSEQKWFERDELPRAVIDEDGDVWVRDKNGGYGCVTPDWAPLVPGKRLEQYHGPCIPLAPETGPALPDDALTVPAGELQVALENRYSEMIDEIARAESTGDIEALCALADNLKSVVSAAQTISLISSERWVLAPMPDGEGDA